MTHPAPRSSGTFNPSGLFLLGAYLAALLALTFLPFGRPMELGDRLNLDPLATIDRALDLGPRSPAFRLMVGNIAAFLPLGVLLPLAIRSRWPLGLVMVGALGVSVAIELGQLGISVGLGYAYRSTDIDDVILNVTGALLGYLAYAVTRSTGGLEPSR